VVNTIKKFHFVIVKNKYNEMPMNPIINICVSNWTISDRSDAPIVTPDLMTDREMDEYIRYLQDDLAAVGLAAKAALRQNRGIV
jgi:hypothetical protein